MDSEVPDEGVPGDSSRQYCLQVNDKFSSYKEFKEKHKQFQEETLTVFKIRNCVTKEKGKQNKRKKILKEGLDYYNLLLCCKHGGRDGQKSKSTGIRESNSYQLKCEAKINVVADEEGNFLQITSMNLSHNHPIGKPLYDCLPENRKLTADQKDFVRNQFKMGANKKKVKNQMQSLTGKKVTSKDLNNIVSVNRPDGNNLDETVRMLRDDYGADCDVLIKDDVFEGIAFFTQEMKDIMNAFPEFIGLDATYKLLNLRAPLYLVVAENSQGYTEVVAACILMHETKDNIQWFINVFKQKHPSWPKIRTVMADKDLTERDIVKDSFPDAKVLICIFHTQRTFNREITTEKLGITTVQRDTAKIIIRKMIYSKSEEEYLKLYDELKSSAPQSVIDYFNKNWHSIRDDWSQCGDFMKFSFLNTTNNRIESLNGKIKTIVDRFSTMEKFVENFFILLTTRQTEHDVKATNTCLKKRAVPFKDNSPEHFYNSFLTDYAFKFVQNELKRSSLYEVKGVTPESALYIVIRDNNKSREVSETGCNCTGHISMGLPCRHIFAVRKNLGLSLADSELCLERWTQRYYLKNQRIFKNVEEKPKIKGTNLSVASVKNNPNKLKTLSVGDKLKISGKELKDINSYLAELSTPEFWKRMEILAEIKNRLLLRKPMDLIPLVEEELLETSLEEETSLSVIPLLKEEFTVTSLEEEQIPLAEALKTSKSLETIINFPTNCIPEDTGIIFDEELDVIQKSDFTEPLPSYKEISLKIFKDEKLEMNNYNLQNVKMPPAQKMRGRPKNSLRTTPIGLPIKRQSKTDSSVLKITPFIDRSLDENIQKILKYFVDDSSIDKVFKGSKIEENEVETKPEKISSSVLDKEISLTIIKPFLTDDAFLLVSSLYKILKTKNVWQCNVCLKNLESKKSIRCDLCLEWYHQPCVNLTTPPRKECWFCQKCLPENY